MSKSKKDVYNAFLLEGATYKGLYEFPQILPTYDTRYQVNARIIINGFIFTKKIMNSSGCGEIRRDTSKGSKGLMVLFSLISVCIGICRMQNNSTTFSIVEQLETGYKRMASK